MGGESDQGTIRHMLCEILGSWQVVISCDNFNSSFNS